MTSWGGGDRGQGDRGDSGRDRRAGARTAARADGLPAHVWPATLFRPGDLRTWFAASLAHEVEQRRLFPWIAVAFGIGILLETVADGPLSPVAPLLAAMLACAAAIWRRGHLASLAVALAAAAIFLGFAAAVLRVRAVDAPVLQEVVVSPLHGFVESIEERPTGGRLVIRPTTIERLSGAPPRRVRVTARSLEGIRSGDTVRATVRLLPPPEPARPGGYDFARDSFYREIGAVGSVSGRLRRVEPATSPGPWLTLSALVDRGRNDLTRRIAGAIGGAPGAVAAALVTGKRGLIDEPTNDALRAAGIYHIVSISGLHMVLAAGVFFWLTRALLALSPALALGWPLKKIAACVGMAGATAYNVFSGSEIATERSLIMILVMQGAILFDRPALSLRNLAISALIVLTLHPEALVGPSFQMSYAAVAALIAMAEWFRARSDPGEDGWAARAWRWVTAAAIGLLLTTLVAGLATGPFGAYHFQSLQPYGLLGNAVTLPLVSLVVMPCGVLGVVALPFGLDRPIWAGMGYAVEAVLSLAGWVAAIPGSTATVPAFGPGALGLFAVAILVLTLLCSGLRWFALVPAAMAMGLAATPARMDVFIARDGGSVAARGPDGRLAIIGPASAFVAEQWLRADGDGRRATEAAGPGFVLCDRIGCVAKLPHGRTLALVRDRRAFDEDCRRATIVVSSLTAPSDCAAAIVLDRAALIAKGAAAIRFAASAGQPGSGTIIVTTVRDGRETRPWSVRRTRARPSSSRPAAEQRPAVEPDDLTRAPGSDIGEPPFPGDDLAQ